MIPYFEKTLYSIVQEISYAFLLLFLNLFIVFNKSFNVNIYRACLMLLLSLLWLNVIGFAIS